MAEYQKNNPLHGITLEQMLVELSDSFGWKELGRRIKIRCFNYDPSVKSSLAFLRKNEWARKKVESMYTKYISKKNHNSETAL